jgi:hypothetical protein
MDFIGPWYAHCCVTRTTYSDEEILMTSPRSAMDEDVKQPADGPPTPISKPIGDAIPTPVEPGLDQPLPEKGADGVSEDDADDGKASDDADDPLGDTETPPGVPAPGPSDFA